MSKDHGRPLAIDSQFESFMASSSTLEQWVRDIGSFSHLEPNSEYAEPILAHIASGAKSLLKGIEALDSVVESIRPWLRVAAGLGAARDVAEITLYGEPFICSTWHEASFDLLQLGYDDYIEALTETVPEERSRESEPERLLLFCKNFDRRLRRWLPSLRTMDRLSVRMERERSAVWVAVRSGTVRISDVMQHGGPVREELDPDLLSSVRALIAAEGKELKRYLIRSRVRCRADRLTPILRYLAESGEYIPSR